MRTLDVRLCGFVGPVAVLATASLRGGTPLTLRARVAAGTAGVPYDV